MTEEFEPKAKCLKDNPGERKKFDELQREIDENLTMLREGGKPILELGKNKTPAAPYEELNTRLTPEEYFRYISAMIDSPKDVLDVTNKPFMRWKKDQSKEDRLKPAPQTLANGGGDCDNISLVAKKLLEDLGCKNKHNYNPRLIGLNNHVICIFTDTDGKLYALDQTAKIKPFAHIYEASGVFQDTVKEAETIDVYEEFLSENGKYRFQVSLDDKTLKPNNQTCILEIWDLDYDPQKFLPDAYLPKGWKKYPELQIYFKGKKDIAFYAKGKLFQEHFKDGTKIGYMDDVILKKYPQDADIDKEYFDIKDRKIIQRNWRNKNKSPYKIEQFDKTGKVIQTEDWDGKAQLI